jgi:hypothetical protein
MNQNEFNSLIESLVESVKDYNLDDSFDYYDAIHQICEGCDHSFVNYKAWQLVDFVKFDYSELFYEVEMEVKELCHHDQKSTLNDIILDYAFNILKVATLKKYNEQVKEEVA